MNDAGGRVQRVSVRTVDERQYLAMHARYESQRQDDPRYWTRWREIADWLHPDPWGNAEPLPTFDEMG